MTGPGHETGGGMPQELPLENELVELTELLGADFAEAVVPKKDRATIISISREVYSNGRTIFDIFLPGGAVMVFDSEFPVEKGKVTVYAQRNHDSAVHRRFRKLHPATDLPIGRDLGFTASDAIDQLHLNASAQLGIPEVTLYKPPRPQT